MRDLGISMNAQLKNSLLLAFACLTVGVATPFGIFDSVANFPLVFAGICWVIGVLSIWREQPRLQVRVRLAALVLGVGFACGGWWYHQKELAASLVDARARVLAEIEGKQVPVLTGLDPIQTDQATWDEAAALQSSATIITFWARWCSPCEKEMPELDELYRKYRDEGLQVIAVTHYLDPEDEVARQSDLDKARDFLTKRDITYPAAITDDMALYAAYRANSVPRTLLVDEKRRVLDYAIGIEDARALMRRAAKLCRE